MSSVVGVATSVQQGVLTKRRKRRWRRRRRRRRRRRIGTAAPLRRAQITGDLQRAALPRSWASRVLGAWVCPSLWQRPLLTFCLSACLHWLRSSCACCRLGAPWD
jgi:hypothetical protein